MTATDNDLLSKTYSKMIPIYPTARIAKSNAESLARVYFSVVTHADDLSGRGFITKRLGLVWLVQLAPKGDLAKPGDDIIEEPAVVALNSVDGSLIGFSLLGSSDLEKKIGHRVGFAETAHGLDLTTFFHHGNWESLLHSLNPFRRRHKVKTAIWIEELLGRNVTVNSDGTVLIAKTLYRPSKKWRSIIKQITTMQPKR